MPFARSAAGATITLAVVPVGSTGGHVHDQIARPAGAFYAVGENVNGQGRPAGGGSSITLTVPASGEVAVVYRSSGVGGSERIVARAELASRTALDSSELTVEVPGLVELVETGSIDTIGVVSAHPNSHWGTQAMVDRLREAGDSLQAQFVIQLQVNDMSLPLGGVFDINDNWRPDHVEHRQGTSADIRTDGALGLTSAQRRQLREQWLRLNPDLLPAEAILDERASSRPHWHFRVSGGN